MLFHHTFCGECNSECDEIDFRDDYLHSVFEGLSDGSCHFEETKCVRDMYNEEVTVPESVISLFLDTETNSVVHGSACLDDSLLTVAVMPQNAGLSGDHNDQDCVPFTSIKEDQEDILYFGCDDLHRSAEEFEREMPSEKATVPEFLFNSFLEAEANSTEHELARLGISDRLTDVAGFSVGSFKPTEEEGCEIVRWSFLV